MCKLPCRQAGCSSFQDTRCGWSGFPKEFHTLIQQFFTLPRIIVAERRRQCFLLMLFTCSFFAWRNRIRAFLNAVDPQGLKDQLITGFQHCPLELRDFFRFFKPFGNIVDCKLLYTCCLSICFKIILKFLFFPHTGAPLLIFTSERLPVI